MSYSHSYGTAVSTPDFLGKLRDFMVSIGWTLEDDFISLDTPLLALSTTGESGTKSFAVYFSVEYETGYGSPSSSFDSAASDTTAATYDRIFPIVCARWEKIGTAYFSPTPVAYSQSFNGGNTFALQGGSASTFTSYDGGKAFAPGDTLWAFGSRYNRSLYYSMPHRRFLVNSVTGTLLTLNNTQTGNNEAFTIVNRPYSGTYNCRALSDASETKLRLTKGGPFSIAGNICSAAGNTRSSTPIWTKASSFSYWFYGDKDAVVIVTRIPGKYYTTNYIGLYDTIYDSRTTVVNTDAYAGNTSVTVDNPALFQVGHKYQINCGKYWNTIVVSAINGNTLTSSVALQNPCPAGSIIGDDPLPLITMNLCSVADSSSGYAEGSILYSPFGLSQTYQYSYGSDSSLGYPYLRSGPYAQLYKMQGDVYNRTRRWSSDRHNVMPIYIGLQYMTNAGTRELAGTLKPHVKRLGEWQNNLMYNWSSEDQILISGESHKIFGSDYSPYTGGYWAHIYIKE